MKSLFGAIALSMMLTVSAHALTETTFVPVTTGTFDDPNLEGFTTWAYRVDAQTDWTNSELDVVLTSGTMNHIQPSPFRSQSDVNGLGDSATFAPTRELGNLAGAHNGTTGFAAYHETPQRFASSWFTTNRNDIGVFDIAAITLSDDANGFLAYRTISGYDVEFGPSGPDETTYVSLPDLEIVNGQIVPFTGPPPSPAGPVDSANYGPTVAPSTAFVAVQTGKFDDPNLTGFTTYAYRVDAPSDWTNAGLQVQLTSGKLNHVEPEAFGTSEPVNGFGDTGGMAPTQVLGDLTQGYRGNYSSLVNLEHFVETDQEFKAQWSSSGRADIGTFDIGMITLSDNANGTLAYYTQSGSRIEEGPSGNEFNRLAIPDYSIVNGKILALDGTEPPINPNDPPTIPNPPVGDAVTSTTFVPVDNGKFNNPALGGFTTFAMRVTATSDWTNADIRIELTHGTINQIEGATPFGGMAPVPGPADYGDTAVFGPHTLLADLTEGVHAPQVAGELTESPTAFQASWFNTSNDDIGTFDIAMVTLSDDAVGTIAFRTIAGSNVEEGGFTRGASLSFEVRNGQIVRSLTAVPEPSSVVLSMVGVLACVAKRKRGRT